MTKLWGRTAIKTRVSLMRLVLLLLASIQLTGCIWLPISSGESYLDKHWDESKRSPLIGQSADEVVAVWSSPRWVVYEGGRTHFIYSNTHDFGLFVVGGGYSAAGGFIGAQTKCYRLSFDGKGNLYEFDRQLDTDLIDTSSTQESADCRNVFWSRERLDEIRKGQESRASEGNREAILIMAQSYGELQPLRKLAAEGDRDAITILAVKYSEPKYLRDRAEAGDPEAALVLADRLKETGPLKNIVAQTGNVELAKSLALNNREFGPLSELAAHNVEAAKILSELQSREATISKSKVIADTSYQQYLQGSGPHALDSLCLSADHGNANARNELGRLYEWGLKGLPRDQAMSLFWYRMSGYIGELDEEFLGDRFSEHEIELVDRLTNDWHPGDCEALVKAQLETDNN